MLRIIAARAEGRRIHLSLAFMLPAILVLAAFAAGTPARAEATRLFVDDLGHEVEIPVKPQRIVSMRGEQFAAPLLELGAPLVGSSGRVDAAVNGGRPYVRGAYDALDFRFENAEVAWIGDPNVHDFEAVAAVEPDLIFLPDFAADSYDRLSLIAPTIVIQIWNQDMLVRYRKIADAAGMLDAFETKLGLWEERLDRARAVLADAIGNPSTVSVVVAEPRDDSLRAFKDYGTLSQVLRDLGFASPSLVADQDDDRVDISPERIHELDADIMISTYWPGNGTTVSAQYEAWANHFPNWREQLHAARTNQYFMINREEMRPVTFAALRSVLDVIVSQIATRGFISLKDAE